MEHQGGISSWDCGHQGSEDRMPCSLEGQMSLWFLLRMAGMAGKQRGQVVNSSLVTRVSNLGDAGGWGCPHPKGTMSCHVTLS